MVAGETGRQDPAGHGTSAAMHLVQSCAVVDAVGERGELDDEDHLRAGVVEFVAAIVDVHAQDVAQAEVPDRDQEDQLGRQGALDRPVSSA